jgi:NADH dehydrogenase
VLNELDAHVSEIAQKRLTSPSIHFAFGGHIQEVNDTEVITDNGKSYPYEIFVWTGGVEANHLAKDSGLNVNKRGQVIVDENLHVSEGIFAAGDIAEYIDPQTKSAVPGVAQVAEDQGKVAGENIYRSATNQQLVPYHFAHWGYIVPLKGRFAAAELMNWLHFDGLLGWALQQIVFLRYLLTIMPFWKAFKKWNTFELELEQ